jgi:hypothetical protein
MYFSNPPRPDSAPTRTNWKRAFADLLANPTLSIKDRATITSMHAHWTAGRSMTNGRKSFFYLIQERTQKTAEALSERQTTGHTEMGLRLAELDSRIEDRSCWSAGFVESLINQEVQRNLSPRQVEILEKIEAEHTNEMMAERRAWATDGYGTDERARMQIACTYYGRTGFYSSINREFLNDPEFVPTKEQYDKVVNNKYSMKVIEGALAEPLYAAGSMVTVRSGTPITRRRQPTGAHLRPSVVCVVIGTSEPIVSACKGCKRYKVLPIGSPETFLVEERDLKRHR